jgi:hypothetical protein
MTTLRPRGPDTRLFLSPNEANGPRPSSPNEANDPADRSPKRTESRGGPLPKRTRRPRHRPPKRTESPPESPPETNRIMGLLGPAVRTDLMAGPGHRSAERGPSVRLSEPPDGASVRLPKRTRRPPHRLPETNPTAPGARPRNEPDRRVDGSPKRTQGPPTAHPERAGQAAGRPAGEPLECRNGGIRHFFPLRAARPTTGRRIFH